MNSIQTSTVLNNWQQLYGVDETVESHAVAPEFFPRREDLGSALSVSPASHDPCVLSIIFTVKTVESVIFKTIRAHNPAFREK
jgi:hypothetical protein